jgi:hypothetical protein
MREKEARQGERKHSAYIVNDGGERPVKKLSKTTHHSTGFVKAGSNGGKRNEERVVNRTRREKQRRGGEDKRLGNLRAHDEYRMVCRVQHKL